MFERLVLYIIKALESAAREIKRAYYETFGDKNLMKEFNQEVYLRCEANKELFVRNAAGFIGRKILEEDGYIIPPMQAIKIGEVIFDSAKSAGMIDILNNVIE